MKYLALWLCGVLLVGFVTFETAKRTAPNVIMNVAMKRLNQGDMNNTNKLLHGDQMTAEDRRVVRPSPELAYSTCVYDLSDGSVAITIPKSKDYLSLALYDAGTNNYFILNSDDIEGESHTITLTATMDKADGKVISPSKKGIALFRRIARDDTDWGTIAEDRAKMNCEAL